jgi:hypothetical protein
MNSEDREEREEDGRAKVGHELVADKLTFCIESVAKYSPYALP